MERRIEPSHGNTGLKMHQLVQEEAQSVMEREVNNVVITWKKKTWVSRSNARNGTCSVDLNNPAASTATN